MFYEVQPESNQIAYKEGLKEIGSLSNLFSNSTKPYLSYRVHENMFCKYFDAENIARVDCSIDAKKGRIGIGLKTWVGNTNLQKIAEFGKLKNELDKLKGIKLLRKVAYYRNERIITTMNKFNINKVLYHVVIRNEGKMEIWECELPLIEIDKIKRLKIKDGNNTLYFSDGKHTYSFNKAKTTLYMMFNDMKRIDEFSVKIEKDPFELLNRIGTQTNGDTKVASKYIEENAAYHRTLVLRLYKIEKGKPVLPEKSGLNYWNASNQKRKRLFNEIYIPFNKKDRDCPENKGFFPSRKKTFDLEFPDGQHVSAKVCQVANKNDPNSGKAIMTNPNCVLGKWLLRDVLNLKEGTLITYDILQKKGIDTVIFTKYDEEHYAIDFTDSDTYYQKYDEE